MQIILYRNYSENNVISKRLETLATYNGAVARNAMDVINPTITLESSAEIMANFAYIPENRRYYFITGIEKTRNNFYTLQLRVDVLMTYAEGILDQTAIVSRSGGAFDAYLVDADAQFKAYTRGVPKVFQAVGDIPVTLDYDTGHAILITAG